MAKRGRKKKSHFDGSTIDDRAAVSGGGPTSESSKAGKQVLEKILEGDESEESSMVENETKNMNEEIKETSPKKKKGFKIMLRAAHPTGDFTARYGGEWKFARTKDGEGWKPITVSKVPDDEWWNGGAGERWFKVEDEEVA